MKAAKKAAVKHASAAIVQAGIRGRHDRALGTQLQRLLASVVNREHLRREAVGRIHASLQMVDAQRCARGAHAAMSRLQAGARGTA